MEDRSAMRVPPDEGEAQPPDFDLFGKEVTGGDMTHKTLLKQILSTRFSLGVATDWADLRRFLTSPSFPEREQLFKAELLNAIQGRTITPEDFEELTGIDQDSQDDVTSFLVEEIWEHLYGEAGFLL